MQTFGLVRRARLARGTICRWPDTRFTRAARRAPTRRVRDAAARRPQRAQRPGGDRRRRRPRPRHRRAARRAAAEFRGVKRRLEVVGRRARGVTVYDDFAHHPTAVAETLAAVRAARRRASAIWAVFEPRSASSCRRVFQADFARAFAGADEVVLAAVFRSSLPEAERLSEEQLVADLQAAGVRGAAHARRSTRSSDVVARDARAGDLVVIMSNGGFGGIHRKLLRRPSARLMRRVRASCRRRDAARGVRAGHRPVVNERAIALAAALRGTRRARRARHRAGVLHRGGPLRSARDRLAALEHVGVGRGARTSRRSRGVPERRGRRDAGVLRRRDRSGSRAVAACAGCTSVGRRRAPRRRARTASTCSASCPVSRTWARWIRRIAAPRHRVPREQVPAGSVGIAGRQTGIYPVRDARRLADHRPHAAVMFDPARTAPSLLSPGDRVRFVRRRRGVRRVACQARCSVIVEPGLLTTVQDLGRWGLSGRGVPVAGPMDAFSHRLRQPPGRQRPGCRDARDHADRPGARGRRPTIVAVAGAPTSTSCRRPAGCRPAAFAVPRGRVIRFGRRACRAPAPTSRWPAASTPPVLGSRATHLVSRMAAVDGPRAGGGRPAAARSRDGRPGAPAPCAAWRSPPVRRHAPARAAGPAGRLVRSDGLCGSLAAVQPFQRVAAVRTAWAIASKGRRCRARAPATSFPNPTASGRCRCPPPAADPADGGSPDDRRVSEDRAR